mmetsp:Transcript_78147/g.172462  ORF Transcript_78147/g.172462 Transcript_78147/m.172462 type:complete len:151 (+) Transcript_78147:136-588(+)
MRRPFKPSLWTWQWLSAQPLPSEPAWAREIILALGLFLELDFLLEEPQEVQDEAELKCHEASIAKLMAPVRCPLPLKSTKELSSSCSCGQNRFAQKVPKTGEGREAFLQLDVLHVIEVIIGVLITGKQGLPLQQLVPKAPTNVRVRQARS